MGFGVWHQPCAVVEARQLFDDRQRRRRERNVAWLAGLAGRDQPGPTFDIHVLPSGVQQFTKSCPRQKEQPHDVLKLRVLGRRHRLPEPGCLLGRQEALTPVVQPFAKTARRIPVGTQHVPAGAQNEGSAEQHPQLLHRSRRQPLCPLLGQPLGHGPAVHVRQACLPPLWDDTRHSAVVGSTGSGKSNLVRIILEGLASPALQSARILVIDPHGEYGAVAPGRVRAFAINPNDQEERLVIPFWALPFDELMPLIFGQMNANHEAIVRDRVQELKREAAEHLPNAPELQTITADSPVPFSIRRLWFELDDFERQTFRTVGGAKVVTELQTNGDANALTSNIYEPYGPASKEPLRNPAARFIGKQLEFARSRLLDPRYAFIFNPAEGYAPDLDGRVESDLAGLLASWVGHDRPLTVLNIADIPSDVAADLVGLLVRIVYETLYWADTAPMSGRNQPLLIILDEAHRFLPDGADSAAFRTLTRIAKEGRKYGVGLMVVTQRPGEIDGTVLSQCGTMIALRTTNPKDRSRVASAFPDDLGGLVELLPSLRTGEGLIVGEAMPVPSRVRIRHSSSPEAGSDPAVSACWTGSPRPDPTHYNGAVLNWRRQRRF